METFYFTLGYMWHEAGVWSDIHKKWFFLPRRMSSYIYNEKTDEEMGTNKLLIASENFKKIKVLNIKISFLWATNF